MAVSGGYGFGIVGCGMIANFHAQAIQAMKGGHLEAVFSLPVEDAVKMADKYGARCYPTLAEFLADKRIDIVVIATPSGAHMDIAVAAANAGKHIICEKPLEITLERIDKMIAASEKNNVLLAGVFQSRYNEATIALKKAADNGRFGTLTDASAYVKWHRPQSYYDAGAWRGTWALDGGGCLMNQGIHTIDLLLHVAGDVSSVVAFADRIAHDRIEVEDSAVAALKFKNGAVGVIQGSTACYPGHSQEVHLCGSDGSVFMKDNQFRVWQFRKETAADKKIIETFKENAGLAGVGAADPKAINFKRHQLAFEDVVRALKADKEPPISGREARRSIEVILAIYQSALSGGKRVDLPLKKTPARRSFR